MSYVTGLQKLGFTEKEARVYMACLKTGQARVAEIARESGLPKSTTLDILFTLNGRGMVSKVRHKNRYTFAPTEPSVIGSWLERRVTLFGEMLPKLEALQYTSASEAVTKIFEGPRSLPSVWEYIVDQTNEVFMVVGKVQVGDTLHDALTWFTNERLQYKLPARVLLSKEAGIKKDDPALQLTERRIGMVGKTAGLLIVWNTGYVSISNDPVRALLIEEQTAVAMMRELVVGAWENSLPGKLV